MLKTDFINIIIKKVSTVLGSEYQMRVCEVMKNNGVVLSGLSAHRANGEVEPIIYLDIYYEQYLRGMPMKEAVEDIVELYRGGANVHNVLKDNWQDFGSVRDKIVYKLVNKKANEEMLKIMPFKPFHDLAIIFYLLLNRNKRGQMTTMIQNKHMEMWGVSVEKLYEVAEKNTPRLLPVLFKPLRSVMCEMILEKVKNELSCDCLKESVDELLIEEEFPMYMLSNVTGLSGASVILYPGALREVADKIGCESLVIIPSSIHETLIKVYGEHIDVKKLTETVRVVNRRDMQPEDVLSDSIYLYNIRDDRVELASLIEGD